MAGSRNVNVRQSEYTIVQEGLLDVHQKQKQAIETALGRTRTLLNSGFHSDLTSQKLEQILDMIEHQLWAELELKHRRTEENIEHLIDELQQCDAVR